MKTFPIMLKLQGRLAVVIGGGAVGLRKVQALLRAGTRVRLVSPQPPETQAASGVELVSEPYQPRHLADATLVMACTDDRDLNARIAADARRAGALVNVADEPQECDFFLPAVAEDGDVIVAVGTGGLAPGLAGNLRDRLAASLPPRAGAFAAALAELREAIKARVSDIEYRSEILRRLSGNDAYERFVAGGKAALTAEMEGLLRARH